MVAQKVEHSFKKRCAIGSIPIPTTKKDKKNLTNSDSIIIFEVLNRGIFFQGFSFTTPADFIIPLKTKRKNEFKVIRFTGWKYLNYVLVYTKISLKLPGFFTHFRPTIKVVEVQTTQVQGVLSKNSKKFPTGSTRGDDGLPFFILSWYL